MDETRDKITKAYILRYDQVETIGAVAREQGDSSASAALRNIVDEWKILKAGQHPTPEQIARALVTGEGIDRQYLAMLRAALNQLGYELRGAGTGNGDHHDGEKAE